VIAACLALPARADTALTVMTFNIRGGGANADKPVDETAAVIRAAGADIVGIQETRREAPDCAEESCPPASESVAARLAAALGYHCYDQSKPTTWAAGACSPSTSISPTIRTSLAGWPAFATARRHT
jgi:exonuclease III